MPNYLPDVENNRLRKSMIILAVFPFVNKSHIHVTKPLVLLLQAFLSVKTINR